MSPEVTALVPGGIAKEISAAQAARILGKLTPSSAAGLARAELAAEFLQHEWPKACG